MALKTFSCGEAPLVIIRVENNLSIRGGNPAEIQITVENLDSLVVVGDEKEYTITCDDDCAVLLPVNAQVIVEKVGGSVSVAEITGSLQINQVDGNVTLNNILDAVCKDIDGNCRVDSAGRVVVENVDGNLKGTQLSGPLNATRVDGNIKIAAVGSVEKMEADGNIKVGILEIKNDMDIAAGGNIQLFLPTKPGFVLDAASGGKVVTRFGEEGRKFSGPIRETKFGGGGPHVKVAAGGNITISDRGFDEVESAEFTPGVEIRTDVYWSEMNERINKRINERMRRVEQRAEAVRRKAEDRVREAMKMVEGFNFSGFDPFGSTPSTQPEPEVEESEKVTDAERMLILNMLHDKKITAEEAERLMDALEGKFHNP